jgi:excisionase family DNA binding protein
MNGALAVTLTVDELRQLVREAVRAEVADKLGTGDLEQLKREQIAKVFQVSPKHVLTMIHREGLPAVRVGTDWRFPKAAVIAWIREQAMKPRKHVGKYVKALKAIEGAENDGT